MTQPTGEADDRNHGWPARLPGGDTILFTILSDSVETSRIAVLDLASGVQRVLFAGGSCPHYSPTGHIVYAADDALWAVPFDANRLEVTGEAVPVLDNIITKSAGAADFDLAANGTLVYMSGRRIEQTLVWVNRDGRAVPLDVPFRLAPLWNRGRSDCPLSPAYRAWRTACLHLSTLA